MQKSSLSSINILLLESGLPCILILNVLFQDSNPSSSEDSDANESQMSELSNANKTQMRDRDGNVSDVQIENQEQEVVEQNIEQPGSSGSELLKSQEIESITTPTTTEKSAIKRPARQHLFSAPKPAKKNSKVVDTDNTNTDAKEALQMMKFVYHKTQTVEIRDKYSILGELVGHTIRNLKTDFSKVTVEHQIHNILYEAQIGKYDFPQYSSTPFSYATSSSTSVPSASPHPVETNTSEATNNDVLSWALINTFDTQEIKK